MTTEPLQRSSADIRYRFDDRDMDFAFQMALGAIATGGLDAGELFAIAAQVTDGDTRSWVESFEEHGDFLSALARQWSEDGRRKSAGEVRMKAFHCYRHAWQFAGSGPAFDRLLSKYESAFLEAISHAGVPVEQIEIPFEGEVLPGLRLDAGPDAPTILVHGGADSGREDIFHLFALNGWKRGYTTVAVDLPGQGSTPTRGMHFMAETHRPIGAAIDFLVDEFGQDTDRLALMGLSLGGYMVSRAVMTERRVAACIASTPISNFHGIVPPAALEAMASNGAMKDTFDMYLWRFGVDSAHGISTRIADFIADPTQVHCPFLTIVGTGEAPPFIDQARAWHAGLSTEQKTFLELDPRSGADAHCQINNPTRLAQEVCDWLDELLKRR